MPRCDFVNCAFWNEIDHSTITIFDTGLKNKEHANMRTREKDQQYMHDTCMHYTSKHLRGQPLFFFATPLPSGSFVGCWAADRGPEAKLFEKLGRCRDREEQRGRDAEALERMLVDARATTGCRPGKGGSFDKMLKYIIINLLPE